VRRVWSFVESAVACIAVALLAGGCGGDADPVVAPPPRHLVFISIDTLRADRLGCYGYERETSPNIDALAARSLRFADALAAANNTAPSHMSMFTGVYPPVHGQFNVDGRPGSDATKNLLLLPETIPVLAQRLSEAGFATLAFTDGGYLTAQFKFDRGFDEFHRNPETVDAKVDRVLERLSRHDPAQPLFLFVHTYAVHAPYAPPVEHDLWSDRAYNGPWRARVEEQRQKRYVGAAAAEEFLPGKEGGTEADRQYLSDMYDACIHNADTELGRLLEVLTSPPWAGNTAILLTSDHGEAFDEHEGYGHHHLYRAETEVPCILHIPGGPTGVSEAPISGVDMAPTVLDLLQLEPLAIADGVSALQHISPDRIRMSWHNDPSKGGGLMLLRGSAKIMRARTAAPWERYDLQADPLEQNRLPVTDAEALKMTGAAEERLQKALELARRLREDGATEVGELSPETIESLRALGYLGDGEG
jgi:arylsulfatase A-like enzyme